MSVDTQLQLYQLSLKIEGGKKSIGEVFNLRATSQAQAVKDAAYLSAWRAATCAIGCVIKRAIVVIKGGAPTSWSAIQKPLLGMNGVYSQDAFKSTVSLNTLSTGIEVRQETELGNHVTRIYRGLPDWTVVGGELTIGSVTDLMELWNEPLVIETDSFPLTTVFDYSTTISPPATGTGTGNALNVGYVTYNDAWKYFLQAVGNLTCFARKGNYISNPDNPSSPLPGYQVQTWNNAVIQGAKDKTAKRP